MILYAGLTSRSAFEGLWGKLLSWLPILGATAGLCEMRLICNTYCDLAWYFSPFLSPEKEAFLTYSSFQINSWMTTTSLDVPIWILPGLTLILPSQGELSSTVPDLTTYGPLTCVSIQKVWGDGNKQHAPAMSEGMDDTCFSLLDFLAISFPTVILISLAHKTGSVVEGNSLQGCSEDTVDAGWICTSVCTRCTGHVMCVGPVVWWAYSNKLQMWCAAPCSVHVAPRDA